MIKDQFEPLIEALVPVDMIVNNYLAYPALELFLRYIVVQFVGVGPAKAYALLL